MKQKEHLFAVYKAKLHKQYQSSEEEAQRWIYFQKHMEKSDIWNDIAAKEASKKGVKPTVHYGITPLADLSPEERKAMKGYEPFWDQTFVKKNPADGKLGSSLSGAVDFSLDICSSCTKFPELSAITVETLPEEFDWRDMGAVTAIRNQGVCGDCWSFSTADCAAGAWFLAGNDLVQLSAQELTSCDEYSYGCNGGYFGNTFTWIKEFGIMSEEGYPQDAATWTQGITEACNEAAVDQATFKAHLDAFSKVNVATEEELQLALIRNGPLSIGVDAMSMEFYSSGVDPGLECSGNMDHAVLLVGWGVEDGVKYWLVKNSWGDFWGEDGYWKATFGKDTCMMADMVFAAYADFE
uniref:Peptidase C1A papain C-terminal domain-containing protein n=1 Tax=Fibrocapsa japonica TaxID=94617 RepID=A0A7S2V2D8_9STRA